MDLMDQLCVDSLRCNPGHFFGPSGHRNKASKNFRGITPICTLTFVIAFIFAANKKVFLLFKGEEPRIFSLAFLRVKIGSKT
jgi:hypothetical protein